MTDLIPKWARRQRGASICVLLCAGVMLSLAVPLATASELAPTETASMRLCLRGNGDAPVIFRGGLNFDNAGSGPGAMMYPAPSLAGMLVAVATHAALSAGARDIERDKLRVEADKVLQPYQPALIDYKYRELMTASLAGMKTAGAKRIAAPADPAGPGEAVIDSVAEFFMTQDQRALILENTVSIRREGAGAPHVRVIRVVSSPHGEKAGPANWFNEKENRLRKMAASMHAQSLDIALADMQSAGESSAPFRTVRYSEGGIERMERAQVVSEQCGQLVLRTLRGNLMSVPRKTPAGAMDASCVAT